MMMHFVSWVVAGAGFVLGVGLMLWLLAKLGIGLPLP